MRAFFLSSHLKDWKWGRRKVIKSSTLCHSYEQLEWLSSSSSNRNKREAKGCGLGCGLFLWHTRSWCLLPSNNNPSTCWVMASCMEPEACCSGVTITVGWAGFLRGGYFYWQGKCRHAGLEGISCREERCRLWRLQCLQGKALAGSTSQGAPGCSGFEGSGASMNFIAAQHAAVWGSNSFSSN